MRAVIQRVAEASVTINNTLTDHIGKGLLVFLGIEDQDGDDDIEWLSGKISKLRIFDDASGVMNLSLKEIAGQVLIVSQFTLHSSTRKGNRPSYIKAAKTETAIPIYEKFIKQLSLDLGNKIHTGEFGANMQVQLVNDGPVTIIIDTKNKE
jgi:D-tyrosyl-tRNA(Tyr) deacylase